jgi:hypothetical protein
MLRIYNFYLRLFELFAPIHLDFPGYLKGLYSIEIVLKLSIIQNINLNLKIN